MGQAGSPLRILYSFPHKLGAARICYTAWQQVSGLAAAGADVQVFPGVLHRPVAPSVRVRPTLARGPFRLPYKLLGRMRALALHDRIVARRLKGLAGQIDVVHTWPLAACETLKTAASLGIPTVLERPNAHTRFAYQSVQEECRRLGVVLPRSHEHTYNAEILEKEEEEYQLAYRILCPSDFVVRTFLNQGFDPEKLVRHQYGYDEARYYPEAARGRQSGGLRLIFVGVCAVRKGLHFALEAWLRSPAHHGGSFLIAGEFLGNYREKLGPMLSDPSVQVLGHRENIPELMRQSDVLVLPSIEEGFGLVCVDAIGSGCVPLVSDACTEMCRHMDNALVHRAGDVSTLTEHITMLHQDRRLLSDLRRGCLMTAPTVTWRAAGGKLLEAYHRVVQASKHSARRLESSTT